MAFEFRLDKVLKYRKRVVEKHTRFVAEANRVVVGINEKMDALNVDIDQLLKTNNSEMNITLNVESLIAQGQWLAHLEDMLEALENELAEADLELSRQRLLLTSAWRDQEVLERLREKQKATWQEMQNKVEIKELDEIGQIRSDRRKREKVSPH